MNKQKRRCIRHIDKGWYGYLFIAPFFVVFAVFGLYPIIYTFFLSFQGWPFANYFSWPKQLSAAVHRPSVLPNGLEHAAHLGVQLPAADGMCAGAVSPVHLQPRSGNEIFPCGLLPA